MHSLRGQFLIASSDLLDPNFERSVVLLLKHDLSGAIGVIVNAPLSVTIDEALGDNVEQAKGIDAPLHRGGPCQGPMIALHDAAREEAVEILPGVNVSEIVSKDDIAQLLSDAAARQTAVRYIVGCAGWAPDQLESELAEGSWLTTQATSHDVFADPPEQLWDRMTTKAGLTKFIAPDAIPEDPDLN